MPAARRRWITIVWLGSFLAAFVATHLPPSRLPTVPWISDKVEHVGAFFFLALISAWKFQLAQWPVWLGRFALTLAFLALYAAVDEWTQPWVGRSCEVGDWLADLAGSLLALGAVAIYARISR
ncbi:MAG TPA: VanZ family protein [Phycisphaerae bacterium]|nr:VanZ family protein [Phycisphaerae bacterium]